MSNTSAAQWVKFFNTAGIPSPAAATYAHKFVENRIQNDMLMDLNKEYLREMDITPMGDIIAILRHAKTVSDQAARDKIIMNTDTVVPIAAVPANPVHQTGKSTKIKLRSTNERSSKAVLVSPFPKARRVLPEHEGKYKIKLPTGSTERSKEILAKKAKLYSDREPSEKSDIFKRLSKNSQIMELDDDDDDNEVVDNNVKIKITGLGSKSSSQGSSIFARLGDKTDGASIVKQIKPILKNSAKSTGITKAKTTVGATALRTQKQKVLLVRKVPIKAGDESDDNDQSNGDDYHSDDDRLYERSNSSEKIVKFASTAEVREIASVPNFSSPISNRRNENFKGGIKARLDLNARLHATKRSFNLKASSPHIKGRLSPVKGKALRLKSDEMLLTQDLPVHKRLGHTATPAASTSKNTSNASYQISALTKRIGGVNITGQTQRRFTLPASTKRKTNNRATASVFDRLGFTN